MRWIGILGSIVFALPAPAAAQESGDQQACMGDAFAFCAAHIPDRDLVRRCLVANRPRISEACRQRIDGSEPPTRRRRD